MQSISVEVGSSGDSVVQVCFPSSQASVLDGLNQQREDGRLCDLSIHVQGHVFKAHRCVLAASSPYFHDQVLLKNMSSVSIPAVMDPLAFESVLRCAYTGQLRMLREDIVNYLTVGSVLQMWHIVDKCTELLKEGRSAGGSARGDGTGGSTNCGGLGRDQVRPAGSQDTQASYASLEKTLQEPPRASQPPSLPSANESQSPSSTNYFSPGAATTSAGGGGGAAASHTPGYGTPSGEEAYMMEQDEEEEEEEPAAYQHKKRGGNARKKSSSVSSEDVGVSDSFGVSSYQVGGDASPQRRTAYVQPSIMPRKQWVVVKAERPEDHDLIVVSGEEGGEAEDDDDDEEDEDDERGLASGRERDAGDFAISHVRTLSVETGGRGDAEAQMDYCQSSEDFLKLSSSLLDATLAQQLQDSSAGPTPSQGANRAAPGLLGQVPTRTQLFPLDMQGNQILVYGQTSTFSMDAAAPPLSGMISGGAFKSVEHGPAVLGGDGGSGGVGSAKVFMCHCGKTFTHKSMRDRHINMHLDLRPFHCPVCGKKFKMKHHLTEHMKTHTGLKPYHCAGCGRKFMWRDSFMRHRSHCERRGGGGGGGNDVAGDVLPGPQLLLPPGEGGLRGGGGVSATSPRFHHAATGAASGIFGSLPSEHSVCTDLADGS
ncbi:zinc finger and BTB domain-containing protein 22b [Hippocampus comes]|uniref:zinc finger and BTB domain-containing protein 22b n=1 Tax=Hippocampus comes TaxID=109280 RepID=UPI00094E8146|nr:PREDICTED: zinc finger and BTB domain-containing protein 22-like [Hippocampus comes]